MAGTPKKRQLWKDIEAIGGVDGVVDKIAGGMSLNALAAELGVSRNFLTWELYNDPSVKERILEARKARAETWSEEALEIADGVPEEPNAIQKAKLRVETRKWMASVNDPDRFGQKQAQVNISIGGLHLDALRKVQAELARPVGPVIEGSARDVTEG